MDSVCRQCHGTRFHPGQSKYPCWYCLGTGGVAKVHSPFYLWCVYKEQAKQQKIWQEVPFTLFPEAKARKLYSVASLSASKTSKVCYPAFAALTLEHLLDMDNTLAVFPILDYVLIGIAKAFLSYKTLSGESIHSKDFSTNYKINFVEHLQIEPKVLYEVLQNNPALQGE